MDNQKKVEALQWMCDVLNDINESPERLLDKTKQFLFYSHDAMSDSFEACVELGMHALKYVLSEIDLGELRLKYQGVRLDESILDELEEL